MSKSKSKEKPKPVNPHAPVHTEAMSPLKRWMIIGVSVFCLLIFSVTTSMSTVIGGWLQGGPPVNATLELPSGPAEITLEDYRRAADLKDWGERVLQIKFFQDADEFESNLAYATLMKLADEMEVAVTDAQVAAVLQGNSPLTAEQYQNLYRNLGFRTAAQFEAQVRAALRVREVVNLMSMAAVPAEADILAAWAKDAEEMDIQYTVWYPSAFAEEASQLEPTDEELQSFYAVGLNGTQRAELEEEQAVAFDAVLLTAEALQSDAVKAWFQPEEPTAEALDGFYNSNRFSLYRRPESDTADPQADPYFSMEELGDRLRADYLLHKAISTLALELPQAEDPVAFAAEKGAEYVKQDVLVGFSELPNIERIGNTQLRRLFNAEIGFWVQTPVQSEGLVYLVRPLERRDRAMPPLAEIRGRVVELWQETQRIELAKKAAQEMLDALPHGEDYVEGDALVLDPQAFADAVAARQQPLEQMGWLSRMPRRTVDPIWPKDAVILPRLRRVIGGQLDDMVDGQIVGLEDYGEDGIVVAQLKGRRDADPATMWPAERDLAERRAQMLASQRFFSDMISYEGLSRTYGLTKVIREEN